MEAASTYLQEATEEDSPTVEDIAGIWLSSDDDDALQEVKKLAQHYFPNVDPDKIIWISGRLPMRVDPVYMGHLLTLTKDRMVRESIPSNAISRGALKDSISISSYKKSRLLRTRPTPLFLIDDVDIAVTIINPPDCCLSFWRYHARASLTHLST